MGSSCAQYIEERFRVKPRILSKEEELKLIRAWQEGGDKDALGKLMASHLFLVIRVAGSFRQFKHIFNDLVQEGNIGLMKAIEKFEISRGVRLNTFAIHQIRQSMKSLVCEQGRAIPFPHKSAPIKNGAWLLRFKKKRGIFSCLNEEQSRECERVINKGRRKQRMSAEQLVLLDQYLSSDAFFSLNQPVSDRHGERGGGETFQDRIRDESPSPEDNCVIKEQELIRRALVQKIFAQLSEKEQTILVKRKMSDEPLTLTELGKELGVSKERIRQIELKAIQKLRRALVRPTLRKMVDGNYDNILSS